MKRFPGRALLVTLSLLCALPAGATTLPDVPGHAVASAHPLATRAGLSIAVKDMLPKNTLGRAMYRKLKVYAGPEHPHAAQQPQVLDI